MADALRVSRDVTRQVYDLLGLDPEQYNATVSIEVGPIVVRVKRIRPDGDKVTVSLLGVEIPESYMGYGRSGTDGYQIAHVITDVAIVDPDDPELAKP